MNNTIVYGINRVVVRAATSVVAFNCWDGATLQPLATSVLNDAAICLVPRRLEGNLVAADDLIGHHPWDDHAAAPARQQQPKKMFIF